MAFIIPMYALLGMNIMMSLSLLLPLPISRPAVFLIKFSKTPVGQAATATICGLLFLMSTVPIYEIYTLHQHKEAQIKSITSKNRRSDFLLGYATCTFLQSVIKRQQEQGPVHMVLALHSRRRFWEWPQKTFCFTHFCCSSSHPGCMS